LIALGLAQRSILLSTFQGSFREQNLVDIIKTSSQRQITSYHLL